MAWQLSRDVAREYALRGQPARKKRMRQWLVEGEMVSVEAIGKRIHLTHSAAANRLKREQAKPGPVTWAGLKQRGYK